jgi:hypothetical protein
MATAGMMTGAATDVTAGVVTAADATGATATAMAVTEMGVVAEVTAMIVRRRAMCRAIVGARVLVVQAR